ncbi:MAG: Gfo/Idh/MocA family oxidoreductase [Thermoguttaceae bacterium]|nr:Gfo/Idh/MocA family oxidoreductase [Thermoguttaceae bacterium]
MRIQREFTSRRRFLKRIGVQGALAVAAPYLIASSALGDGDQPPASQRITVGFIGVGSHGIDRNLKMFLGQQDAQVAAICDVHQAQIDKAFGVLRERFGEDYACQATRDWRDVVARDDIDAVMISTHDPWHVPMSLAAIRSGKDVISEKPTLTVAEGRALADTVQRFGAVFQFSTEGRSVGVYHRMAELVRNGRIGKLERIRVMLPAGPGGPGDAAPKPVPPDFDWDMWLGPAPWAPYREGLHPFHWRWVSDYSGGMLTDWGAHLLDFSQWANDTERTGPVEVEGTGRRHEAGLYDTYHEYHLKYRYANGVELTIDSGGTGIRFEGSDGWVGNASWRAPLEASSDEILRSEIGPDDVHLFTCPAGEHRNFLDCVKSRRDPYFPAEIGHRCCTIAHLGNIAITLGRRLQWDPNLERFTNNDTANLMLARAMREPWGLH